MKEGRVSIGGSPLSFAHLSVASCAGVQLVGGFAPVAQFSSGPSGGQGRGGACRSKWGVGGEHVPDRFAEAAADLDRGDLGAAFSAVPLLHSVSDVAVGRVPADAGVGGLDQRPAQVVGAVFAQGAAPIAFAGLVDAGAQAGVADEFAWAGEAGDVADL